MAGLLPCSADPQRDPSRKLPKPVRKRYSNPPTRSGNSELETDVQPAPRPTAPDASGQRHHAVIVFADVVGYSRLMADDEPGTLDRWTALYKNVLKPEAERRHGQ